MNFENPDQSIQFSSHVGWGEQQKQKSHLTADERCKNQFIIENRRRSFKDRETLKISVSVDNEFVRNVRLRNK
ncbi:hypothetical protein CEXT_110451 [Caerostris extrusa]|uniref:Uncharacterized protein n=1 Tax=Caerostris extrusa TaxID=172846 RepID=A0AAV4SS35_CAEEX|nr:hypothetical protein CEXT_110451 [Caerostris extrusa]